jgi:DMSO/TMAO reductase YedYZ heme-binding membrane subunit
MILRRYVVTTTRTRSRGRKDSRSSAAREGAERRPVILASAAVVVILLVFASVATPAGHVVVAATQHFLLKFGGVFALIALTASVGMGLIATDRIIMSPGHRVLLQAVHRAVSFAALAFLIIHIVLEITAQHLEQSPTLHVHVLDAFIPFLSQYRTFYMAEGTIASDLIVLLVATSIVRRRFTASGNAWKWRAIHYSSYAALILGVLHGLLAGRKAVGTYVYWSYGAVVALIVLGVAVRFLATSLRSKDMVAGAAPASDRGATGPMQSMQTRAAALGLMGQISGTMPFATPGQIGGASGATQALPALQAADPGPATGFAPQYKMAAEAPQAILY